MDSTNILYGKKWAVCGDSFTNGDFSGGYSETFENGPFAGKYKTYGYLIAERNIALQTLLIVIVQKSFAWKHLRWEEETLIQISKLICMRVGSSKISCVHYNAFVTGPSIPLNFF